MTEEMSNNQENEGSSREKGVDISARSKAIEFLGIVNEAGFDIGENETREVLEILTTDKVIDMDRSHLTGLMGINPEDNSQQESMGKLASRADEITNILNSLVRNQIQTGEYGEEIKNTNWRALAPGEMTGEMYGEAVDFADISDAEMTEKLSVEDAKRLIAEILDSDDMSVGQGMFWNAMSKDDSPYVLKTPKQMLGKERAQQDAMKAAQREVLKEYPFIRKTMGGKFLPKQMLLVEPEKKEGVNFCLIQEKVDIRGSSVFSLTKELPADIKDALENESSKEVLREFLDNTKKLGEEYRLVPDLIGDNLFFKINDEGQLEIKLLDYGSFHLDKQSEGNKKRIEETSAAIGRLKELAA